MLMWIVLSLLVVLHCLDCSFTALLDRSIETGVPSCLTGNDNNLPLGLRPEHPLRSSATGKVVHVYGADILGAMGEYKNLDEKAMIFMHDAKNGSVQLFWANDPTKTACVVGESNSSSKWTESRHEEGKVFVGCEPGNGFFTPICHSHFNSDGSCDIFVLRSEFTGRLVNVTLEGKPAEESGSLNALGPKAWGMDATNFDLYQNSFIGLKSRKQFSGQMPTYSLRVNFEGKDEPEYLGMDSSGVLSLVQAKDLPIAGPDQVYRIYNEDGTTSFRSEANDHFIEADKNCGKLHLRKQYKGFEIFSWCDKYHIPLQLPLRHLDDQKNKPSFELESLWYTGLQFYIAFERPDGSVNVLIAKEDGESCWNYLLEIATISGNVSDGGFPIIQPVLKANNLYKENKGYHHLSISGTNAQLCFDEPICNINTVNSISKPLTELFPQLFFAKPINKNSNLVGTKPDGKQVTLPLTYFELETAMGLEANYGEYKIVLIIQPSQMHCHELNHLGSANEQQSSNK